MKHFLLFISFCLFTFSIQAETLKMKDGTLISGSILSQTQYTLNLATSYGNITLNQREIEEILPDKHRIILNGGTQLVGIILDMDEFNLKLQTDDGAIVHVDMPQIVSIEAYDYNQGQHAQQEFVEKKLEHEQQAQAQAANAQTQTAGHVAAAGGLTFDTDIDQVFDAKQATVVNGQVQTPSTHVQEAAPRPLTDEEAFLKNVKSGAISPQDYAAAAKQELATQKQTAKKEAATPTKRIEKNFSKYFAVQAGAMPLDLKLAGDLAIGSLSLNLGSEQIDVGGTSAAISSKFLWRIKESNLWLGPTLAFASISNNDFSHPYMDLQARSNGSIFALGAAANYYLTPQNRFAFYLTASAQYEMLSLNYKGDYDTPTGRTSFSNSISSNGPAGAAGVGVETWVDDVMVGLEIRQTFASRKDELKKSSASNTIIQLQLSWKF